MNNNKKSRQKQILRVLYFGISLLIAYVSAVNLWYTNVGVYWEEWYTGRRTLLIVGLLYCLTYWFFAKMYNAHKIGLYRLWELAFSQGLAYGIADACLFGASFVWFHNFEKLKIHYFLLAYALQTGVIAIVIFVCNRLFQLFDEPRKICLIYGNESYRFLLEKMNGRKYRYNIQTCLEQNAGKKSIMQAIRESEDVYLYEVKDSLRKQIIMICNQMKKEVHITLSLEDIIMRSYDVSHAFDTPLVRNRKNISRWYFPFVKRAFDILVSLTVLVILSPVLIITAIAIKAYDGGPVFYKQVRMTKGGRQFRIIKFRSMIPDAEKGRAKLAAENDDRITPVGKIIRKTRIDELPQLINILKGDMTCVGPRPERPEIAREYEETLPEFSMRLAVKAGLTGYAQVYGKYNTTPEDKLKLDMIYITNQSVLMDLQILFYTVKIIFVPESTEGVAAGQETALK